MKTLTIIAALLLGNAVGAQSSSPFKPMAFLADHCWKGEVSKGQTDEHCFTWLYGGIGLRDTHVVRTPGRPDYVGETTYYYDSARKKIEFLYIENAGGVSVGSMEPEGETLVFPPTAYVNNGEAMTYRVRWTPIGEKSYEAHSEMRAAGGAWQTQFKTLLNRVD